MKLQDFRKLRGLTRAAMGELVGITGIQVWRIETGRSFPLASTIRKIREATADAVTADDHSKAFESGQKALAAAKAAGGQVAK